MYTRVHERGLTPRGSRTATFEGTRHGADISFFHVDNGPGEGPSLHTHPYTETWIVLAGEAEIRVGEERLEARQGDVITVGAGTPHAFRNTGSDRLEIVCIHASARFETEWLDDDPA